MSENARARVAAIYLTIQNLDAEHGCWGPAPGSAGRLMARFINPDPRWSAQIADGLRVGLMRVYEDRVGEGLHPAPDHQLFQIFVFGKRVLAANLFAGEFEVHHYVPGTWETWFGFDGPGPFAPVDPLPFAELDSAEWKALMESDDLQAPPLRVGPSAPNPSGTRRRSRTRRPF